MKKLFLCISIIYLSGCTLISEPDSSTINDAEQVLDETISLINETYPYISLKEIDTDSLHTVYSSKLDSYQGDQVYKLLQDLLYELKDGHVGFYTTGGHFVEPYIPRRKIKDRYAFSLKLVRNYSDNEFQNLGNGKITYGRIDEDIGYIFISTLLANSFDYLQFSEVLKHLENTKGLILDVRSNGGGNDRVAYHIVSHFIKQPFLSPLWLDPQGNEVSRSYIEPNAYHYSKPVVLLQNGTCFSAAEGFISMMREMDTVTTLGDTTAGGTGAPDYFDLSYNIRIKLSRFAQLTYQREYIEWNGVAPDILVTQSKMDLERKRDLQLEAALSLLKDG